ncbi:4-hydroxythreonine-4-phosphate dehydrogenase PdxA [Lewinellaceae bacterium SD302]|nr:4-hydroxythreonine-4-phosphate dehydrogenase PdxA [Lewinellaceae bacterium SD302]
MSKPIIGISIGDPNGIGPEVILKTLGNREVTKILTPVIYASAALLDACQELLDIKISYQEVTAEDEIVEGRINLVNCLDETIELSIGQSTAAGGKVAASSLEKAVADLKSGRINGLVTAPINKANMPKEDFPFPGHTEFLTTRLEAETNLMFLVTEELRVGLVTNHVPVAEVARQISKPLILAKLAQMDKTLRRDFGIEKPLLAVLALNPHAGDNGVIGQEDDKIVRPAVYEAKRKGHLVMGPYPADGFFGSGKHLKVDGILAMYHDQGLVPFKALSFGQGVNFTGGLPAIRTSPDHGTAYDIAGKGVADAGSFRQALFLAHEAVVNRRNYDEDTANPLVHREQPRKPKKKGGKPGGQKTVGKGGSRSGKKEQKKG